MEDFRRQLNQQPYLTIATKKPASAISVSSVSSSMSPETRQVAREPIVISSSSEDERGSNEKLVHIAPRLPLPQSINMVQPEERAQPAMPIHVPTNKDLPYRAVPQPTYQPPPLAGLPNGRPADYTWQAFDRPGEEALYDPVKTAAEAEKDLKEFFQQAFDGREEGEEEELVDMRDAIVDGFRENIRLLPHQIIGRKWMTDREKGKKRGGILADDMGLGKTIQTLSRIVEGRPKKADREDGWAPSTLVIAPVSLVSQWAAEINKMAVRLTVREHHGASRTTDPGLLETCHVVVTSYQTVASEYATFTAEAKDESRPKPSKPKRVVDSDEDDLELFGRPIAKRSKSTTKAKSKDALFRVKWFRIVLDEAHNIKNRKTKAALACCALESKFRWCLTGTPMQNNVEELYSLIKFLRIKPLNDWDTFNEQIAKPVKRGKPTRAMKRLHVVLKGVMLRRKKTDSLNGKALLDLPARQVNIVPCEFDTDERQFYFALENKIEDALNKFTKADKINYTSVLVLLLRLRQACNHPSLVAEGYRKDLDALAPRASSKDGEDDDVDALADELAGAGISTGKKCHVCQTWLTDSTTAEDEVHCTDCISIVRTARRGSELDSTLPPDSAKIRKILDLLDEIDERKDNEKTIIFSQFTSMLDLIQVFLKSRNIKYARYDGSMSKDKREASINAIKTDKATSVILISFKAGSTGLNLTACNNVILVDLWWNPALEEQAFDRAHRYGQKRDVNIYKLTIEKTVEERILQLQEKKRELSEAALSGDKVKNSKLGLDDLLALFRPGRDDED